MKDHTKVNYFEKIVELDHEIKLQSSTSNAALDVSNYFRLPSCRNN